MIIHELRAQTKVHHDRLESKLPWLSLDLNIESYRKLLIRFYAFYNPLEEMLMIREEWTKYSFDFESRQKVPLLARDLKVLSISPADADALNLLPNQDLPRLDTFERALGCLYVLEGSTLGGQLISRHLKKQLGIDSHSGAAFFASYQEQVGSMWKTFLNFLNECALKSPKPQEIVDAACDTFQKFEDWFTQGDLHSHGS